MKHRLTNKRGGWTLVESLMTMGCASFMLAAIITAGVALQRSFMAVEGYSTAEGDQLRMLDYIALDCRRAVAGSVPTASGTSATPMVDTGSWIGGNWVHDATQPTTLILTLPNYYNSANSNQPYDPQFVSGVLQYGSGSTTICYYKSGTDFKRLVMNGGTSNTTTIARNIASFSIAPQDLTQSISCTITFSPQFTYLPGPGPIAGTTVFTNTFFRNASARQ